MQSSETSQLKRDAASGVRWNVLGTGLNTLLNFIQTAVLARFLAPEAFGLIAIVGVPLSFAQAIGEFGISASIVRTSHFKRGELAALFWLQLLLTICVFIAVVAVARLWGANNPGSEVPGLLMVVCLVMLITVLGGVHRALAQRDLRFRFLAVIGVITPPTK
jgi:O-antigen/teichoic acid export membrane protein